jgi:hypothetical protein
MHKTAKIKINNFIRYFYAFSYPNMEGGGRDGAAM